MDADLAPVLHVAPRTAQRTYDTARTVCALLPATLAAMRAGDLEPYRATAIAQEVPRLRPEICTRVEAALFPAVLGLPTARVRAATRRAVAAADPDEVARRAERARADRYVLVRPGPDPGMSEWVSSQPAAAAAAAWAAVDELAHGYVADGEHRSLDQARADAMIDLILGQATITTTLTLTLPATLDPHRCDTPPTCGRRRDDAATATHAPGGPGGPDATGHCCCGGGGASTGAGRLLVRLPRIGIEVPRVGLIPSTDLAVLLTDPDTRIRPALHDPATGTLTDLATRTYRPHTATATFVRTRDGTCRFPGCATPATRSHLDHITPPRPRRTHPPHQPDHPLPTPPPPQTPRRLDPDHDPHRHRHLDQRHRPAIPHPPHRPPPHRRLSGQDKQSPGAGTTLRQAVRTAEVGIRVVGQPAEADRRDRSAAARSAGVGTRVVGQRFGAARAGLPRAMNAAEEHPVRLHPVTDDLAAAVLTHRRHLVDRALERVERVDVPRRVHLEAQPVVVAADLADRHGPSLRRRCRARCGQRTTRRDRPQRASAGQGAGQPGEDVRQLTPRTCLTGSIAK